MKLSHAFLAASCLLSALPAAEPDVALPPPAGGAHSSKWVFSLLPKSLQRKPSLDFHVITEMTAEGEKLTPPTPQRPDFYIEQPGPFTQMGMNPPANEKPPPVADLERAMQNALATNGYLPAASSGRAPHLAVVFSYGSFDRFSNDFDEFEQEVAADDAYQQALLNASPNSPPPSPPIPPMGGDRDAAQLLPFILGDTAKRKDIIDRASLIGGARFAHDLSEVIEKEITYRQSVGGLGLIPPDEDINSPFRRFVDANSYLFDLVEESFSSCYFVVASAYDYPALLKGNRLLLWRTKMTVNSLGISMTESLPALIASAGPYLGREMSEAATITRRISREGRVEIGTPVVVPASATPQAADPSPREKAAPPKP